LQSSTLFYIYQGFDDDIVGATKIRDEMEGAALGSSKWIDEG
jgi:hypothetical protein